MLEDIYNYGVDVRESPEIAYIYFFIAHERRRRRRKKIRSYKFAS